MTMLEEEGAEGEFKYLDASAIIYDDKGRRLATVDYARTNFGSCVEHSGDQIDREANMGTHIININLKYIGAL